MTAIADTGFVLAVAIATDKWHDVCLPVYRQQRRIYLPQTALSEIAYLLTRAGGNLATARFLTGLPQTKYRIIALEMDDIKRTAELLTQYADSRVDFVDATLAAVAERLEVTQVLTIDKRDFHIIRPAHADHFEILP